MAQITCPSCNGHHRRLEVCYDCKTYGSVDCKLCGGDGEFDFKKCPECRGRGRVQCPQCGGQGNYYDVCNYCVKGFVDSEEYARRIADEERVFAETVAIREQYAREMEARSAEKRRVEQAQASAKHVPSKPGYYRSPQYRAKRIWERTTRFWTYNDDWLLPLIKIGFLGGFTIFSFFKIRGCVQSHLDGTNTITPTESYRASGAPTNSSPVPVARVPSTWGLTVRARSKGYNFVFGNRKGVQIGSINPGSPAGRYMRIAGDLWSEVLITHLAGRRVTSVNEANRILASEKTKALTVSTYTMLDVKLPGAHDMNQLGTVTFTLRR